MSRYLGHKTNNEAEYWALLFGLREARRLGGKSIRIFTDSELVERQVKGLYRVKNLNLKVLHTSVIRAFKGVFILCHRVHPEGGESGGRPIGQSSDSEGDRKEERRKGGVEEEPMAAPHERSSGRSRGEESPSSAGQGGP